MIRNEELNFNSRAFADVWYADRQKENYLVGKKLSWNILSTQVPFVNFTFPWLDYGIESQTIQNNDNNQIFRKNRLSNKFYFRQKPFFSAVNISGGNKRLCVLVCKWFFHLQAFQSFIYTKLGNSTWLLIGKTPFNVSQEVLQPFVSLCIITWILQSFRTL